MGITRLVLVFAGVLLDVDATEASLSFEDSPGEALRFLRFRRGLPFNFGAEKNTDKHVESSSRFAHLSLSLSSARRFAYLKPHSLLICFKIR